MKRLLVVCFVTINLLTFACRCRNTPVSLWFARERLLPDRRCVRTIARTRPSMSKANSTTSITLLAKLDDISDQQAWNRFVEAYSPQIFSWCQRFGLQENDAADVTQSVLLKLVKLMQEFDYDANRGSFRGWLKTVTSNLVKDMLRGRKQGDTGSGSTAAWHRLVSISDPSAFSDLEKIIEQRYEQELVSVASERVRSRVQTHTWQAYVLTAIENQSSAATAKTLGIPIADVYVAKSRIIKMLKSEIEILEKE